MITLVIGGPDSGKSEFAESLAEDGYYTGKYYIATMNVADDDARARREKHLTMREGKGFETLEIPYYIDVAPELMRNPKRCVVLLECIANLVGNAMHEDEWKKRLLTGSEEAADDFISHVVKLVTALADAVGHLIVVSSEYEPDGYSTADDAETALYVELLHAVNMRLKRISEKVYER